MNSTLKDAYSNTTYTVHKLGINIRIGETGRKLNSLLKKNDVNSWAYITAWNPFSEELDAENNSKRNDRLLLEIKTKGLIYYIGTGVPDKGDWTPEESFLILGISLIDAKSLGKHFEQNAIIFGELNKPARLIMLNDK
ncbi:MAG: DUF3293 domain-containing protein [Balneolaceae bacterium]